MKIGDKFKLNGVGETLTIKAFFGESGVDIPTFQSVRLTIRRAIYALIMRNTAGQR